MSTKQLALLGLLVAIIAPVSAAAASTHAWNPKDLIALAKATIRAEVEGKTLADAKGKFPAKPVFVTIERKGRVIGCRGALQPRGSSLEGEITLAARAAAKHDPRYRPLLPKDLDDLQVTITIVEGLEPISNVDSLVTADGLVLVAGSKVGIVLPWEGKDPSIRLKWAYKKAGVELGAACRLQRMKAERFGG